MHMADRAKICNEMSDLQSNEQTQDNQSLVVAGNSAFSTIPKQLQGHEWKPGQSGNPSGRPKKLTRHLERLLDKPGPDGKTYAEKLVESTIKRAIAKSDFAANMVWERAEGKVPQAVTGADGGPVQFQVAVVHASLPQDIAFDTIDDGEDNANTE